MSTLDRLTLSGDDGDGGEDHVFEMPEEELLRLDDGTPLPPELTELRSLLRELKLEKKLPVMRAWCDDEEVESVAELGRLVRKKEFKDSLIAKLGLKPGKGKATNLLDVIAERATKPAGHQQMNGRI